MTPSMRPPSRTESPVPATAGIGLKGPHCAQIVDGLRHPEGVFKKTGVLAPVSWFEVHSENYMGAGGPPHRYLEAIRRDYPLSVHGVGLSLGSAQGLDEGHLARVKAVVDRYQPGLVSEHLSWSIADKIYLNDLAPLPYTAEALDTICANVARMQDTLGRTVLIENPSTYLQFGHSEMSEPEFVATMVRRTGCKVLFDVNNVYVSAVNHTVEPDLFLTQYLDALDPECIREIHLAGHHVTAFESRPLLIDDHGSAVCPKVWEMYRETLHRTGPVATLIERDCNIPELAVLCAEAAKAADILGRAGRRVKEQADAHAV
ncbi:MNIO family bufferin maturase [Varunaivibrio sulfuroxidans]|uniref:UPF0276 protein EDD55_101293 n=1 Tax=Varunaivibrio sulfuroxidans TaxID=1773489 RepID=A0A4R3JGD2_9PROT|nr:DUF692 domain-containing protein [Varunaivibrio sulfuroxidans]TCS64962.1 hypothetical protein EDD55_101293 [Varunaivibrio sulfuroxidans]WES29746.1 DUF692 domain-containing protein [Varunaivibrio sulfuroxidans]